jgi:hypothetical protein
MRRAGIPAALGAALLAAAVAAGAAPGCGGGTGAPAAVVDAAEAGSAGDDAAADGAAPTDGLLPGLKVVLVTNGAATPSPGDAVLIDRLRGRGFEVSFASDVAVTAASVAGQDLVLVSSSAESGPLGTKLRDVTLPIVCLENGAFPTMGFAATGLAVDYGSTFNQTTVEIVAGAPPALTASLTGSVTITAAPSELGWAVPPASALVAATLAGEPTHAALFAYATGAEMVGLVAPARRVGFAIRETAAANLTADGLSLFDAAVTFALSN